MQYVEEVAPRHDALYGELQGRERVLRLKRISDAGLEKAVRAPLRMADKSPTKEPTEAVDS